MPKEDYLTIFNGVKNVDMYLIFLYGFYESYKTKKLLPKNQKDVPSAASQLPKSWAYSVAKRKDIGFAISSKDNNFFSLTAHACFLNVANYAIKGWPNGCDSEEDRMTFKFISDHFLKSYFWMMILTFSPFRQAEKKDVESDGNLKNFLGKEFVEATEVFFYLLEMDHIPFAYSLEWQSFYT